VMLITHIGRIVIDGETMSYIDDIGSVFEDAGFLIDSENRRLLDVTELIGFFNSIPSDAWACYDPSTDGPTPAFPEHFVATVSKHEPCLDVDGTDQCTGATAEWQTDALETIEGKHFAVADGGKLVYDKVNGITKESWTLQSRAPDFSRTMLSSRTHKWTWMSSIEPEKHLAASSEFTDNVQALSSGGTPNLDIARDAGFFCKRTEINAGGPDPFSDVVNAAYMGAVTIDGTAARHWLVRPIDDDGSDIVLHLYDSKSAGTGSYEYLPMRVEMYSVSNNALMMRMDLSEYLVGDAAIASVDTSATVESLLPQLCHWYGTLDIGATDLSKGIVRGLPSGGVVPADRVLLSSSPYPMADGSVATVASVTDDLGAWAAEQGNDDSAARAAEFDENKRRSLLGADGHRQLQGYSCCKSRIGGGGGAFSKEFDPLFSFSGGAPLTAEIEVSATFGYTENFVCAIDLEAAGMFGAGFDVGGIGGMILGVEITGSVYADWDPLMFALVSDRASTCFEVGSCISASFTLKVKVPLVPQYEWDLFTLTACVLGGVQADPKGNQRGLLALQLALSSELNVPGVASVWYTVSLFLKYWLRTEAIGQIDYNPVMQYDFGFSILAIRKELPSISTNLIAGNDGMKAIFQDGQ